MAEQPAKPTTDIAVMQTTQPLAITPSNVVQPPSPQPDPKAKAFTDKIMELITEAYNLATELATIDDPNLLKHPALQAAQRVVAKVKELRRLIS